MTRVLVLLGLGFALAGLLMMAIAGLACLLGAVPEGARVVPTTASMGVQTIDTGHEPPPARFSYPPGQGDAGELAGLGRAADEPARPPFVWDYLLGPGLHGEPFYAEDARLLLHAACEGSEQECSWWSAVMVRI